MNDRHSGIIAFIKQIYGPGDLIPLHAPRFIGHEIRNVNTCILSTFVSYIGEFVCDFEDMIKRFTKAHYAVATVNGTSALHTALILLGVKKNDEVITQALTFVATANAINYCGARPVFVDSDRETLGMSADKLEEFLSTEASMREDGFCYNLKTSRRLSACVPVHVFGHPVKIDEIRTICKRYNIALIEDSAEALGSFYKGRHAGTFGDAGIFSFNGNKIITTGGGGMLITDDKSLAERARHITTTAKVPHKWEYVHDEIGYNYRLSNINAAIGCAQMENLATYLQNKRDLAMLYETFFAKRGIEFIREPRNCKSNYWLNAIILNDRKERDAFLEYSNNNGVMTRPAWRLLSKLDTFRDCQTTDLHNAQWLEDRIVNIPSSVRL